MRPMQRCPGCQYLVPEAWDECKKCGAPLRSEAVAATRSTAPVPANPAAAAAAPPQYRTSLPEATRRRRRAPLIVGVVAVVAVSLAVGTLVLRADKAERVPANVSAYARGGAGTEYRDAANVFVATLPVTPIELPQHITVSQHDITVHVASAAATQRWSVVIGWLDLPGEFTRGGFIGTIP